MTEMRIGILNCDLDESNETNGGYLLNEMIDGSEIIDCTDENIELKDENVNRVSVEFELFLESVVKKRGK